MTAVEIIQKLNNTEYDKKKAKAWLNSLPKSELRISVFTKLQATNGAFTKEDIISWLNETESIEDKEEAVKEVVNVIKKTKKAPTSYKKGDVVMHSFFRHPCVLFEYKKETNTWICGSLTSEPTCEEILEECKSRFFTDAYFTNVLFTMSMPEKHSFMFTYDNNRHLTSVFKKLKEIFV